MPWYLSLAALVVALVVVVLSLRCVTRWAGEKGWVYNKYNPRPPGSGSLGILESIYQPSIEYVIEERTSEHTRAIQDESGDGFEPDEAIGTGNLSRPDVTES